LPSTSSAVGSKASQEQEQKKKDTTAVSKANPHPEHVNIALSHDWPTGIWNYGDMQVRIFRGKEEELGSFR